LVTSTALSKEMDHPTPDNLTTTTPHATPATLSDKTPMTTLTTHQPALMSTKLIPLYAAPSTLYLAALPEVAPPHLLERNISATSNPSTTTPIHITNVECPLSYSLTLTFMASINSKMIQWSSQLSLRTLRSKSCS